MARRRLSEGTRERLLDEGVAAFLEHGYHGTGIQQLVDRVGVPKGSFYNYFESKEELGAAAIRHYALELAAKMEQEMQSTGDPITGLHRFFRRLMTEFEAAGYVGGCLVANLGGELEGSDTCRTALAAALGNWRDAIRRALRRGQEQGAIRADLAAEALADLLVDAWEGAVIRMKIERSLAPLHRCLELLLDGYFRP